MKLWLCTPDMQEYDRNILNLTHYVSSLLYRIGYSVVTFLSIFSRSEHDGWMARCETEVMSLEWHLEQQEAWVSHLTHHTIDSERIDSVNENIWLNAWFRLKKNLQREARMGAAKNVHTVLRNNFIPLSLRTAIHKHVALYGL